MNETDRSSLPREMPAGVIRFVETVKQFPGVSIVTLFGSSVTEHEWRQTSDWDIGIITRGISAAEVDRLLREQGITKDQIGVLGIHAQVFFADEIERFKETGRATGHPMKAVLLSNMLETGRAL